MTIAAFLADLRRRDVHVWPEGDQLRCNAPAGALTPELRDALRDRKSAIVEFLRTAHDLARQERAVVPLRRAGHGMPVFAIPGHNGDVFSFRALVEHLDDAHPFFGLQPPGLDGAAEPVASVEELAGYFANQINAFQPHGPLVLAGYCAGGVVAYELAQQLRASGRDVRAVVMFAGAYPDWYNRLPQLWQRVSLGVRRARRHARVLFTASGDHLREYVRERLTRLREQRVAPADPILALRHRLMLVTRDAVRRYSPEPIDIRVCLVYPSRTSVLTGAAMTPWRKHARNIQEYYGPVGCEGDVMLLEPHAGAVAAVFRQITSQIS